MDFLKTWPPLHQAELARERDAIHPLLVDIFNLQRNNQQNDCYDPSQFYLDVRPAGSKGKGVFAKRNIPANTKIIDESSFMLLESGEDLPQAIAKFNAFDEKDRQRFLDLSFYEKLDRDERLTRNLQARGCPSQDIPVWVRVSAIFVSNAFNGEDGVKRLFQRTARLNHSCAPNAHTFLDPTENRIVVHTLHDIPQGEEVQIAYFNILQPRDQRQDRAKRWGFTCTCPICEPESADVLKIHEEKRARIRQCEAAEVAVINGFGDTMKGLDRAVEAGYEMLDLVLDDETLMAQLPHAYDYLATLNLIRFRRVGDHSMLPIIEEMMEKSYAAEVAICGRDSAAARKRWEKLTAFWALSDKMVKEKDDIAAKLQMNGDD